MLKELEESKKIISKSKDQDHTKNLLLIETIYALKEHPDYVKKLVRSYSGFSGKTKQLITEALYIIKGESMLAKLNLTPEVRSALRSTPLPINFHYIDNITLIFPVKSNNDILHNSNNTDYLWAAFYVTGDNKYIIKILQFLSQEDFFIRKLAIEMLNRDFQENLKPSHHIKAEKSIL